MPTTTKNREKKKKQDKNMLSHRFYGTIYAMRHPTNTLIRLYTRVLHS